MLLAETAVATETAVAAEMQSPAFDVGLVRKAMAWRVKYRKPDKNRIPIPLSRMGVHPSNRGGMYPQADTVRNLGLKILRTGFSQSEANHEGVVVEEVPFCKRAEYIRSSGSQYESYADYNVRNCDHQYLARCFLNALGIMYATLSHSHLLLVLLSWLNGADWKLEDEPTLSKFLNANGAFCDAAVAALDDALERVLRDGVLMEVLSWKMMEEEPTAASLISQALNTGHHLALRTSELTAMSVLAGAVAFEKGPAVADAVCFETVREKVRAELDIFVDTLGFIDVFEFVVNMGRVRVYSSRSCWSLGASSSTQNSAS